MMVSAECQAAMLVALEALEPAARKLIAEAESGGELFAARWQLAITHAGLVVRALDLFRAEEVKP